MNTIRCTAVLLLAALAWPLAGGQTDEVALKSLSVDALKAVYLACDRAAMHGTLGAAEIAQCSVAYEALKRRAFDGDFQKLLAWSSAQRPVRARAQASP
jgi:hypothetical protein